MSHLKKHEPYAQHINLTQNLWEQPPGSGLMFSGEGQPLGPYELRFDGTYVPVSSEQPVASEQAVDLADPDEEAYLSQQADEQN